MSAKDIKKYLRRLGVLILTSDPASEEELALAIQASVKEVERAVEEDLRRQRRQEQERLALELDKSYRPSVVRRVIAELGF